MANFLTLLVNEIPALLARWAIADRFAYMGWTNPLKPYPDLTCYGFCWLKMNLSPACIHTNISEAWLMASFARPCRSQAWLPCLVWRSPGGRGWEWAVQLAGGGRECLQSFWVAPGLISDKRWQAPMGRSCPVSFRGRDDGPCVGSWGRDWVLSCETVTTFLINKATLTVSLEALGSLEDYHQETSAQQGQVLSPPLKGQHGTSMWLYPSQREGQGTRSGN